MNAFSLWSPDQVTVTKGGHLIQTFNKTAGSSRKWCKNCGGHIMTDHPTLGLVDVYSATIPTFEHQPQLHVWYSESVLRIKDGKPKFKDGPKELGGSGETLPE